MVTLSDVLQTSSSSSSLLAADSALPTIPQEQQQGADRTDLVTSPPRCGVNTPTSANHNSVTTTNSEHKLANSRAGGGGGSEGFERLQVSVEDEEHGQETVLPEWLREGTHVTVGSNKAGAVRYVGAAQFAEGVWVGVELDTPVGRSLVFFSYYLFQTILFKVPAQNTMMHFLPFPDAYCTYPDGIFNSPLAGKNDGSVGGHRYFHCKPGYGVLVRPSRLSPRTRASRHTEDLIIPASAHVPVLRGDGAVGRRGENRKSWSS